MVCKLVTDDDRCKQDNKPTDLGCYQYGFPSCYIWGVDIELVQQKREIKQVTK